MVNPKIFKAYDIRGIYPTEINEESIVAIIKAIYTFYTQKLEKTNLTIVLGQDMRISSPSLAKYAEDTLVSMGAKVINIGLVSTPTVYFATYKLECDGGIQISASHNPKDYNGIKFLYKKNGRLVKVAKNTGMEKVKNLAISGNFIEPTANGQTQNHSIIKEELDYAKQILEGQNIKPFKIVIDPANAMGIPLIEIIEKEFPQLNFIKINFNLDGTFPSHEANPLKFELLKPLQEKVISEKADFGIATDGDGDRIFFTDEKGEIIPATMITSLMAKEILAKKKGETILADVRYIQNTKKIIEENGGKMQINVVGHSLITEHLNRVNGAMAGESSGHYFFRETGGAESSIRVILYVLSVLSRENLPLSQIINKLKSSEESGEFNFELNSGVNSKDLLQEISQIYNQESVSWLDGLTVDSADWRFNIRTSNTEPLLRLNLEANSKNLMIEKLKEVTDLLLSKGATAE